MYDLTMSKINDLLNVLEDTCVTSSDFVKAKLNVQDELQAMADNTSDWSIKSFLIQSHTTWRKLGLNGTLKAYSDAVLDLKFGLRNIEAIEAKR